MVSSAIIYRVFRIFKTKDGMPFFDVNLFLQKRHGIKYKYNTGLKAIAKKKACSKSGMLFNICIKNFCAIRVNPAIVYVT